ncbi:hypothetical protein BZL30_1957 [Mycobacterium kansasii]|uniref:Uncharacterized protein n=1 Tax=Mycobacterium kansasii TaxID=1768 RepID=A0A1V3XIS8_MYCKA|nr:hypothetical protein BZL30_1957 [Mycobacterium kansasii]
MGFIGLPTSEKFKLLKYGLPAAPELVGFSDRMTSDAIMALCDSPDTLTVFPLVNSPA